MNRNKEEEERMETAPRPATVALSKFFIFHSSFFILATKMKNEK
jgi:hypothetical protein